MLDAGRITAETVFLVSGGGRGITATCVIGLARRYRCRFILLGRTAIEQALPEWADSYSSAADLKKRISQDLQANGEKPHPRRVETLYRELAAILEIRRTLNAVEDAGGKALYLCADITNPVAVQTALQSVGSDFSPIAGVIHGAGALADRRIEEKTAADFEKVFAAKVEGLQNILQSLPFEQLKWLVLFSSIVGFYGNAGQTDYAAANAILDLTAQRLARLNPDCRAVSINWGPWEAGMVTELHRQYFAERGITTIPVEKGVQALIEELERKNNPASRVIIGGLNRDAVVFPGSNLLRAQPSYRVRRELDPYANPFLQDHVIGDYPVLPAVFAVGWMAASCENLHPGYHFHRCENFKVLKGLIFADSTVRTYTLDLRAVASEDGELCFDALIWSKTGESKTRYHYSALLALREALPLAPSISDFNLAEDGQMQAVNFYQDGTLFHGPSFQGIRRVLNISPQQITVECKLPGVKPGWEGQFTATNFSPLLADIQGQAMLIWTRRFYQAASLPLKLECCEYYRAPEPGDIFYVTLQVCNSDPQSLVADVVSYDLEGKIYLKINGAEVTISPQLNQLFSRAAKI
ncbi:MAG TPA: SDR family NAD(P)-dependent oxidoreductase [Chloroflexia bacterium]|nr:SDR family NAD(P)-dependent oxidoreductase [Chloroflexia bacterium]